MKTFTPFDNSFQQCIDDNGKNHYLADCEYFPKETVELVVIVQPFKMRVKNVLGNEHVCTFVIGLDESTGLRHLCFVSE